MASASVLAAVSASFGQDVCGTSPNDCCASSPSGTPGCSDFDCCALICSFDPFCCATMWDSICATEAQSQCTICSGGGVCGPDNPQDCCVAGSGLPGCNDTNCCNTVCAADPFCCQTAWDGICATEAASFCVDLCGVPCDLTCPSGAHIEAELCGEDTNGGCNMASPTFEAVAIGDVCGTFWAADSIRDTDWYTINLPFAAEVTVTIQTNVPAAIGLIGPGCPPIVYAFNGAASCGGTVTYCLPAGENVVFAAPGFFSGLPCGSGENNNYVLTISVGAECSPLACGSSANDCCTASPDGTPFCSDETCCNNVCSSDPFCCSVAWDSVCAQEAAIACLDLCGGACDLTCPPGAHSETELCGEDTNGGCNMASPTFEAITVPGDVCGNFWADGSIRDTDWYSFNLPVASEVTITIQTLVPAAIGLIGPGCPPLVYAFNGAASCGGTVTYCMPAGENVVFAAPGFFSGLPCGSGDANNYVLNITVGGPCSPAACGSSANDCCAASPDGTPFCSDEECCNAVCAQDPFCCSVSWDSLCAGEALSICAVCGGTGVENDECVDALPIGVGVTPFSTTGATTSPPPLDPDCDEGFGLSLVNDIWYAYTAPATGTVTVSLCGITAYDSRIAAYDGDCDALVIEACNDDFCGLVSEMSFDTTCGDVYYIRIGGYSGSGSGEITITQTGACLCPADLDGDGTVGPADLAILLGAWGGTGPADLNGDGSVGAADLAILLGEWGPC